AVGGGSVWFADKLAGRITRVRADRNAVAETLRTAGVPGGLAVADGKLWLATGPAAGGRGGTLRVVPAQKWAGPLDPALVQLPLEAQVLSMTNDGLVGSTWVGGVAGETLVPDLALAIPRPTDNGRTYVFRLRRGIRYSTGAPLRPSDVRRALER